MSTSAAEKAALRTAIRRRLAALPAAARQAEDALLTMRLLALPEVARAQRILLYFAVNWEIDTRAIMSALAAQGKELYLPRCLPDCQMEARRVSPSDTLVPNAYGIPEPGPGLPRCPPEHLELILVPGLCFDTLGFRLGQGGGYYDRYLPHTAAFTVGLCRDSLLVSPLPRERHDRPMDLVLTATACLRRKKADPEGSALSPD